MDPVTATGLIGTAITIAGSIGATVKTINDLREKYQQANLLFKLLDNHLNTVQNALDQIGSWSQANCSEQLLRGADSAVDGISTLVLLIDEKLERLAKKDIGGLTVKGRLEFILGDANLREYVNMLNGQIIALDLLLHTYTCQTHPEQQQLLENEEARQVLANAKELSPSLICNDDRQSRLERMSWHSQKTNALSIEFPFDSELVNSGVYKSAMRENIRGAINKTQDPVRESRPSPSSNLELEPDLAGEQTPPPATTEQIFWQNSPDQELQTVSPRLAQEDDILDIIPSSHVQLMSTTAPLEDFKLQPIPEAIAIERQRRLSRAQKQLQIPSDVVMSPTELSPVSPRQWRKRERLKRALALGSG